MMKYITSDKWHGDRASPIATTMSDPVYANGAVQLRIFSEAE